MKVFTALATAASTLPPAISALALLTPAPAAACNPCGVTVGSQSGYWTPPVATPSPPWPVTPPPTAPAPTWGATPPNVPILHFPTPGVTFPAMPGGTGNGIFQFGLGAAGTPPTP